MRKTKQMFSLLLAVILLLPCLSGIAEPAAGLQPMAAVDQEAFLSWIRKYAPEADITWDPWYYTFSTLHSYDVYSSANLSEDTGHVESVIISSKSVADGTIYLIRELCAAVGDTLSAESEQAVREFGGKDWTAATYEDYMARLELDGQEICVSDGGKVSIKALKYDADLCLYFSEEASAAFTQDALFNIYNKAWNDILYVTLSRNGYFAKDEQYNAEVLLNCEGAVKTIDLKYNGESEEEALAFFLDGAELLSPPDALESVKAIITEKLPAVMADTEYVNEHYDPVYFNFSKQYDGIYMTLTFGYVPADAIGFIGGQKFVRNEHMRAND